MGILIIILCILLNTYIGIVFKLFERFGISNNQAIAANYWVCTLTGILFSGINPLAASVTTAPYFPIGISIGFFYFITFIGIALSTIKSGVATTQIAMRSSLVIPVAILVLFYNEPFSIIKLLGVIAAVASVIFVSASADAKEKHNFWLPLLIFVGSGMLDFVASLVQKNYLQSNADKNAYLILCFGTAAICSTIYVAYLLFTRKEAFVLKNIVAGILLGFPNYFSIYFLLKALGSGLLEASALIPLVNISVVLLSTLLAFLFFKEMLNKQKLIGILLALLAIICIVQ